MLRELPSLLMMAALVAGRAFADDMLQPNTPWEAPLARSASVTLGLPGMEPGATYALDTAVMTAGLGEDETVSVELALPGAAPIVKSINFGDPSFYIPFRVTTPDAAQVTLRRSDGGAERPLLTTARFVRLGGVEDAARFEAEPNDTPQAANALTIGTTVEGSVDDVDYLSNVDEGKNGLDWFKVEIADETPCLVIFELDVPDRDVSVNMRCYTLDAEGKPVPYLEGKDPMEIVHDRERERYSKVITRTFSKGTYYIEVNANHPRYMLRTYTYPVPPYDDPQLAVEVGLRYIMDVGDAWFAQIPREGNIYQRVQNMHETAMRCTACHPSVFSTEPQFVAHKNGYPIQSKSNFRYVVERIYNSITPFYGPDGLWWQRFIAIPLQSQGMQGNVLINFEKQISGRETDIVQRFGPLPRAAWSGRNVMPEDEQNGVVPLDSEFGYAWRDWSVMNDVYRRTGDESYARAADNLEAIYTAPETEARIESLHDRVLFVQGLSYMGKDQYRDRIDKHVTELLAQHNTDGGWDEEGRVDGTSAVYATGHVLYALMESGLRPEQEPKMQAALAWLLSRQESFGGWFQTDTHENFRTPMRESRYALIALASAYPKGEALKGMGNWDGGPAVMPAPDTPAAEAIAKLDNIWEVPESEYDAAIAATLPLLERPEAPVRAAAAELLGRIGGAESTTSLLALLNDPSKLVWREAAWSLRQLGNRAEGVPDALLLALRSADPLVRRGASRVFAYQFQGMDGRMDIAETFVTLASDSDVLTRLQALRTLRQWWYRSEDPEFKTLVMNAVIERMGVPETAAMRTNLAQNMYILLDENQSGGVSMQRNLRDVSKEVFNSVIEGRMKVEEEILLRPVLAAMANGNELQREALLESFDGSFFKGRYYARIPRNMIDVGNDREFSFMYMPDQPYLEQTLGEVLASETRPAQLGRVVQLATFFEMPQQANSATIELAFLDKAFAEDETLRTTARELLREHLVLNAGGEAGVSAKAVEILTGDDRDAQGMLVAALARSPQALGQENVKSSLLALLDRNIEADVATADFLPLANSDIIDDRQALAVLDSAWRAMANRSAGDRIPVIEALVARNALFGEGSTGDDGQSISRRALRLLRDAATDKDVAVREKLFDLLPYLDVLRKSRQAAPVLFAGLSDESPAIRSKTLALAKENEEVWFEEDVHEYVLKLLIAADPKIRSSALAVVGDRKLISEEPRYAARVKTVMDGDADLAARAEEILRGANIDPASVTADSGIATVRVPDVLYFRDHVNDYFYRKNDDKNSCADCHATHTILGLVEPPKDGRPLTDSEIVANYKSLLKVINAVDPEQSLVLRKPRSPFGTGQASEESPTGVTHVGGTRWADGTADEAYQAILAFIRTAQVQRPALERAASVDSYSPEYPPNYAVDGNPGSVWHTEFVGAAPGYPHEVVLTLAEAQEVAGITYVPRQDSENGRVKDYEVYVSEDGKEWGSPVASGAWVNDTATKVAFFPRQTTRFIKLRGLSEVGGQPYMSAAEVEPLVPVSSATQTAKLN